MVGETNLTNSFTFGVFANSNKYIYFLTLFIHNIANIINCEVIGLVLQKKSPSASVHQYSLACLTAYLLVLAVSAPMQYK